MRPFAHATRLPSSIPALGWALAWTFAALPAAGCSALADQPDILIADFEQPGYGDWESQGDAFGPGPAQGTLPDQMEVRGYQGQRLVNSYHGTDRTTGRLTSPAFEIQRDYIHFLIGGGKQPEHLSMRLVIEGQAVRTATGNQDRSGGEERLDLTGWDVAEFRGQTAHIEIIDQATGGWGHLTVDHLVQSNERPPIPVYNVQRELPTGITSINLPVDREAPMRRMKVLVEGEEQREFDIQLAEGEPDYWVPYDIAAFEASAVTLWINELMDEASLQAIRLDNDLPTDTPVFEEAYRPQYHFTSARGWLNDPNGLVYHDGAWHLYYQHNPFGTQWDNMTWGHATSDDLIHWRQQPIGLHPQNAEDMAYSGSAVVDHHNTSGWASNGKPAIVAAYTSTGRGECIVYSTDGGMTFTEYEGNPVIDHDGRDPRIFWYEPGQHWCMVLYSVVEGRNCFTFYTSPDLKQWAYQSTRNDWFECPDLVELPVEGDSSQTRWMLLGASGHYQLGSFDGKTFTPDSDQRLELWYGDNYAGQRYTNTPDGRVIYIGWARHLHTGSDHQQREGMPFNQQMSIPMTLTLRETPDGLRVHARPVHELEAIRGETAQIQGVDISNGPVQLPGGELLDIELLLAVGDAETITLDVRGRQVTINTAERRVTCGHASAPVSITDGKVHLRLLVDRMSTEVFINHGRSVLCDASANAADNRSISASTSGGAARIIEATIYTLTPRRR
ncbi:MAG: GH32 C-terminal domain-containing protein [Phycisphaerales bacterium JB063]